MEPVHDFDIPKELVPSEPLIYSVVRRTWLSYRPHRFASIVAALATLLLVIGSILYQRDYFHARDWMAASAEDVFVQHHWWKLWTTLFAHGDMGHLLSNSLLFFVLGYFLTGYFGLAMFPVTAFIFGGITNAIVLLSYPPEVSLIGVSGVVYWMGGTWLALYFSLDLIRTRLQRALRIGGVALGVFFPVSAFGPSISYSAHLVGFLLGLAFGIIYFELRRKTFAKAIVTETVVET